MGERKPVPSLPNRRMQARDSWEIKLCLKAENVEINSGRNVKELTLFGDTQNVPSQSYSPHVLMVSF